MPTQVEHDSQPDAISDFQSQGLRAGGVADDRENGNLHSTSEFARTSYNTGYGDFCFGRLIDRHRWRDEDLTRGSYVTPITELDDFQRYCIKMTPPQFYRLTVPRSGPFKFFKLPVELRHKIYRLLLWPFFIYDSTSKVSFVQLFFEEKDREDSIVWQLVEDYETPLSRLNSNDEDDDVHGEFFKKDMQIAKECHQHKLANHPGRSSRYDFKSTAYREGSQYPRKRDHQFIEWIRQASNVSPLFRKELGDVFWTHIKLSGPIYRDSHDFGN